MDASSPPSSAPQLDFALNDSIGYLLARSRACMAQAINQRTMAELGLTNTQAGMLYMLATGRCSGAAALSREFAIDASAVTRLIDRLEQRGLLLRIRSEKDRRAVELSLTPAGLELAQQAQPIFQQVVERMLRNFTPEEACFLKSLLRRILENGGSCRDDV